MVICMYINPSQGQNNPLSLESMSFSNHKIQSICQLAACFVLYGAPSTNQSKGLGQKSQET